MAGLITKTLSINKKHELDEFQKKAVDFIDSGESLFITGKAGTGKTEVLKTLRDRYAGKKVVAVVAPTGVAAENAGGFTMHSFFRLPVGTIYLPDHEIRPELYRLSDASAQTIRDIDILVIDEISMVRCDTLDATDDILRHYRHNDLPFGGVQLVMFGDLYQLSPVTESRDRKPLLEYYNEGFYFFFSYALQNLRYKVIELQHIWRTDERIFINLLNNIRIGEVNIDNLNLLNTRVEPNYRPKVTDSIVTLMTHNHQTKNYNKNMYRLLKSGEKVYKAKYVAKPDMWHEDYPADPYLSLKKGARVMFLTNDTDNKRYSNGTMGWVDSLFEDMIIVKIDNNENVHLERAIWEQKDYIIDKKTKTIYTETTAEFHQFPLKLAWAVSIHKSQGLTFKEVAIDASKSFAYGQVYVALSRCTTLGGIHLLQKIPSHKIIADEVVKQYMNSIDEDGYVDMLEDFENTEYEYGPLVLYISNKKFESIKSGTRTSYSHGIYDDEEAEQFLVYKDGELCMNRTFKSMNKKLDYTDKNGGDFPFIMKQYTYVWFVNSKTFEKLQADIDGRIDPKTSDNYAWGYFFRFSNVKKLKLKKGK